MKLKHMALISLLGSLAATAHAGVTLTLDANYQWFDPKLGSVVEPPNTRVEPHVGWGGMLGYRFDSGFGLDLDYQRTDSERKLRGTGVKLNDTSDTLGSLNGYYVFNRYGVLQPYLLLGAGHSDFRNKGTGMTLDDTASNAGLGLFIALTRNVAIRAEAREIHTFDHAYNDAMVLLGLTFNTGNAGPAMAAAAAAAPEPEMAPPPPPPPAPTDSDGDGVPDSRDKCPNTPHGVKVDQDGCPLDSDRDGVPDYLDKCPNTPLGAKVDENGCPIVVKEAISREVKILFDTNKWEIKPEYKSEVEEVAKLAKEYPTSFVEIQGFTDNSGSKKHNKDLSQHRANSVRDMLVHDYAVDPNRVTAVGYGATNFVADNKSEEGKAKNRRVIAVLSGTRHTMAMGAPIRPQQKPLHHHHHHKAAGTAAPAAPAGQ